MTAPTCSHDCNRVVFWNRVRRVTVFGSEFLQFLTHSCVDNPGSVHTRAPRLSRCCRWTEAPTKRMKTLLLTVTNRVCSRAQSALAAAGGRISVVSTCMHVVSSTGASTQSIAHHWCEIPSPARCWLRLPCVRVCFFTLFIPTRAITAEAMTLAVVSGARPSQG